MTKLCPHKLKGHSFFVSIQFEMITNSRFNAHRFKASKLMPAVPAASNYRVYKDESMSP